MHRFVLALLALTLTLAPARPGRAQEGPPAPPDTAMMTMQMTDTVVVTASRFPEGVRRTGRRVTVWTRAELDAQPAVALDEVLRTTGGVEAQSRAGFGVQSDYTMRGSNFKGVLLLLDGMPLNDPQTAHYLSDFPIPLDAVARIEVLRGPASALYGPDAVGGVIHIFTHAGLRQARAARALPGGDVASAPAAHRWAGGGSVRYGAHTFYDAGAVVRAENEDQTASAAARWQGAGGEVIAGPQGNPVLQANGSSPLRTDFARQSRTAALYRQLGDASVYARAGADLRDFNAYHFYTDFDSDRARSNNRTYWLQSRLQGAAGATQWQVQAAAKQHEGLYVYNPRFESSRDYSRKLEAQAQASRALAPGLAGMVGLSAQLRGVESASLGTHQDGGSGAFVSARWQAARRLTLNGSARLDYDTAFGVEATPQASLAYAAWPALTLRAAAGRSVRAPTYTERYIDTEVEEPAGNLGNPDVQPERSWSYEAGLDARLGQRLPALTGLSLHATAFYRDTDRFIDYARLPEEELFVARNILQAQTRGVEVDATWRRAVGPALLSLTGTYTRLSPKLRGAAPGVTYKYALTSARHLVQSALRISAGRLTLGARGLWKERRDRPSYGVMHGRVRYDLPVRRGRIGLTAEVRNLFDVDYAEVFDAPMPGRWWVVGAAFDL